jgi:hypothetical protein
VEQFAIDHGVGFQNNSLDEWDANWFTCGATGTTGPYTVHGSVQSMVDNWRDIPVVFERGSWLAPYNKYFDKNYYQTWWSYLNALDKHADIIFPPNWDGEIWYDNHVHTFPSGVWGYDSESPNIPYGDELREMNQFALDHLGVDESTTPDVWTVLFDTPSDNCTAQQRDHQFFLYRLDTYNGHTIPNAHTVFEQDVYSKAPYYEGKYTRRTDQATGQHLMYFNIDDGYHFAADPAYSTWTVELWYLNNGDDTIHFDYYDGAGQQQTHVVQKPGGTTGWVRTSFTLENAYFANNAGYDADFRIDAANDGPDEYIHMVLLSHEGHEPPTATPTPTNTNLPPTATATADNPPTTEATATATVGATATPTTGSTDVTPATETPTTTPAVTVTGTVTVQASGTATATTSVTGTATATGTPTATRTPTRTFTPSVTFTPTATRTGTQPPTATPTQTATVTPTAASVETVNALSTAHAAATATQAADETVSALTATITSTSTPVPTLEPIGTLPGVPVASVISGTPVVLTPTPTNPLPVLVPATWTPEPSPTVTETPDATPTPTPSGATLTLTLGSIPCAPAIGLQVLLLGGAVLWALRSGSSEPEPAPTGNTQLPAGAAAPDDEDAVL